MELWQISCVLIMAFAGLYTLGLKMGEAGINRLKIEHDVDKQEIQREHRKVQGIQLEKIRELEAEKLELARQHADAVADLKATHLKEMEEVKARNAEYWRSVERYLPKPAGNPFGTGFVDGF